MSDVFETDEESRCLGDVIDDYHEQKRFHNFEGDSGLDKLSEFLTDMGYKGHGFKYGTPIESFLSDNSGAVAALLDWVSVQNIEEWKESLEQALSQGDNE